MSSKRGRPTLAPEEDARRLALWQQGLTDPGIAAKCGVIPVTIWYWRHARGLQAHKLTKPQGGGVPIRQVLPPEGCELVLSFFGALLALRNRYPDRRVDVTAAMQAWREGLLQRGETA